MSPVTTRGSFKVGPGSTAKLSEEWPTYHRCRPLGTALDLQPNSWSLALCAMLCYGTNLLFYLNVRRFKKKIPKLMELSPATKAPSGNIRRRVRLLWQLWALNVTLELQVGALTTCSLRGWERRAT